jgi:hypothetical protein
MSFDDDLGSLREKHETEKAAQAFGVISVDWHQIGVQPQKNGKAAVAKGAATRRRRVRMRASERG